MLIKIRSTIYTIVFVCLAQKSLAAGAANPTSDDFDRDTAALHIVKAAGLYAKKYPHPGEEAISVIVFGGESNHVVTTRGARAVLPPSLEYKTFYDLIENTTVEFRYDHPDLHLPIRIYGGGVATCGDCLM